MHIIFNVTGKLGRKKRECVSVLDGSQSFFGRSKLRKQEWSFQNSLLKIEVYQEKKKNQIASAYSKTPKILEVTSWLHWNLWQNTNLFQWGKGICCKTSDLGGVWLTEVIADDLLIWTKNNQLNNEELHNVQQPTEEKSLSLKKTKYRAR